MISFGTLLKRTERIITDNSPAILAGIGVAGVVGTAYLTGRATFKAAELINDQNRRQGVTDLWMPPKEKIQLTWKLYIPAATTGLATVTCIIAAHRIGNRRAAAIAAAYALAEKGYEAYRDKVVETIGERKEEFVRAAVAQDRLNENPPPSREVLMIGSGDVLCLEAFTGRYFTSNVESLRSAENQVNEAIINGEQSFCLSELYDIIGLSHTSESDHIGWNLDKLCKFRYSTAMSLDGRPCLSLEYAVVPLRGYNTIY